MNNKGKFQNSKAKSLLLRSHLRSDYKVRTPVSLDIVSGILCVLAAILIWVASSPI